jgi:hypothetical protein
MHILMHQVVKRFGFKRDVNVVRTWEKLWLSLKRYTGYVEVVPVGDKHWQIPCSAQNLGISKAKGIMTCI